MKNLTDKNLYLLFFIILLSCGRKEPEPTNTDIAGKGGSATLKITPKHHSKNIDSCTIYIKYNAQDIPNSYDDSIKAVKENGKPVATFSQLKKGKYYLYGYGWDTTISNNVKGGIPYTITEEKVHEISLPVTEGD
ncbi:MAG: hypothetical protein JNK00_06065 [Flavipsychrobacter sp.]|nr:hypothetical protein [Flavipsychrobacter sp.]